VDCFLLEFIKDIIFHEKVQNVNELHDRIVRAAECVTNKMLSSTFQETEYHLDVGHVINTANIENYRALKKLCEVQCLKMY